MFPLHSVLRYYPSNDIHYTAKMIREGVLQIKGGPRCMYSSVEEWLDTLPGSPDPSRLLVTSAADENERRKQLLKQKRTEKQNTSWHIPSLQTMAGSLPWARYIYTLIREHHQVCSSGLLRREDMRLAYNHLVRILTEYSHQLRTCPPLHTYRYRRGIQISELENFIIPIHHLSIDELIQIITNAYRPLYEMLCENVVPYMERIAKERRKKQTIRTLTRYRNKYVHRMMKLTARYERDAEHLRHQMEYCQEQLHQAEAE